GCSARWWPSWDGPMPRPTSKPVGGTAMVRPVVPLEAGDRADRPAAGVRPGARAPGAAPVRPAAGAPADRAVPVDRGAVVVGPAVTRTPAAAGDPRVPMVARVRRDRLAAPARGAVRVARADGARAM